MSIKRNFAKYKKVYSVLSKLQDGSLLFQKIYVVSCWFSAYVHVFRRDVGDEYVEVSARIPLIGRLRMNSMKRYTKFLKLLFPLQMNISEIWVKIELKIA